MLLTVRDLSKGFETSEGRLSVLDGVSFDLEAGETLALTGESGSGKSTLLHIVGGLEAADQGSITLDGTRIDTMNDRARAQVRRTKVGLVFQQFNLIPSMNVGDNLAFHARLAGQFDGARTQKLAERLGLSAFLTRYPEQLSGGQQQRVAIGRTLALNPPLILADEPTGNLDEATSDAVMDLMLDLAREANAGLLMVTHSTRLAERLDRNLHLSAGHVA